MNTPSNMRRIAIFLIFAFGIAWAFALIIFMTGGLINSPQIIPGTSITLALVLEAVGYMSAPALAHIITRLLTREGWQGTFLRPQLRQGWPYWLAAWFVPAIMTILGTAFFFVLFPRYFDPSLGTVRTMLDRAASQAGKPIPFSPWALVVIQTAAGVLTAPLFNSLFTLGEEFGWRAYLLLKLLPLGERKALLLTGLIWGVWHAPIIAMGHNYGLNYPGAPWTGILAMIWFTLVTGTFLGWAALRGGSVWPAVIGHAAINGISGIGILFVQGKPNPLLGPLPVGLLGSVAWTVLALWILLRPAARRTEQHAGPSANQLPRSS